MWRLATAAAAMSLLAAIPASAGQDPDPEPAPSSDAGLPAVAAFAPGTDPGYAQQVLQSFFGEGGGAQFQLAPHWDPASTALGTGGSGQGDSVDLTWSIIPDGTSMPSQGPFDTTCTSDLIATFNAVFGPAAWPAEIEKVWDDWEANTGNTYTPAVPPNASGVPIDDGAAWPGSPGLAGVRGDIRIGGCTIDGDFGILAFNFFPSNGDMKIESGDMFFATEPLSPDFHNTFSHEHGHGAGLAHVCPGDGTKLMEPIITDGFLGLQHDDQRGAQRHYGDRFELVDNPNDTRAKATPIGPVGGFFEDLSIDDNADQDWFKFRATEGDTIDVTLDPVGMTYLEGPDPVSDLCASASPTSFNSLNRLDLGFEIRDASGVLLTVDAAGRGGSESRLNFPVTRDGLHYVRVFGESLDRIQLYDLDVTREIHPANDAFGNFDIFTRLPQKLEVDTTGATLQGPEPTPCGSIGSTVWYKLEPGATMEVVANTFQANYDTVLAVHTGTSLSNLVPVVCNDDFNFPKTLLSKVTFTATVGKTYWIQAGGFLGATGDLAVKIRPVTPFFCRGGRVNILGTAGDDVLSGGPGFDRIRGFGGNDTLIGRRGNDKLCGDTGADLLVGGPDLDRVDGGPGPDVCFGEIQFSC